MKRQCGNCKWFTIGMFIGRDTGCDHPKNKGRAKKVYELNPDGKCEWWELLKKTE